MTRIVGVLIATLVAAGADAQTRVVDLTASNGVTLKATLFSAPSPGPGVLLLHQCNRHRGAWNDLAQRLAAAGLHVLTMDLRGFGESGGGRFNELPRAEQVKQQELWPGDIDVAFQYLVSQPNVLRDQIGVGGASCGVNNAVHTARRHPEVKSLVLMSGTTDVQGRRFLRRDRDVPTLFVFADDDEFPQSVATTKWLYSMTATASKRMIHYTKGGHGADIFGPHPELITAVVEWFRVTTPGGPSGPERVSEDTNENAILALIDEPGGAATALKRFEDIRQRDGTATPFPEAIVNVVGYEYLQAGELSQAIDVFRLNTAAFPASPNAFDSLSDAYLAAGQPELARQHAQKALDLLPAATDIPPAFRDTIRNSAEQKLKQLGERRR